MAVDGALSTGVQQHHVLLTQLRCCGRISMRENIAGLVFCVTPSVVSKVKGRLLGATALLYHCYCYDVARPNTHTAQLPLAVRLYICFAHVVYVLGTCTIGLSD